MPVCSRKADVGAEVHVDSGCNVEQDDLVYQVWVVDREAVGHTLRERTWVVSESFCA